MSNEELVTLIQAGDRDRIVELWHQVQRMVYKQAARWAGLGGTTIEDMTQAGFIAVLRAVDSYDPSRGTKFSTHLFLRLRAVRGKYWHDLTVDKKTLNAAMKRLRHPDCSKRLRTYL